MYFLAYINIIMAIDNNNHKETQEHLQEIIQKTNENLDSLKNDIIKRNEDEK
jgi:hypothetical protein